MCAALIPGTSNVFRFPVESRVKVPSIEWIYDLKPDCRMVDQVAEAWGFEVPSWDLYDEADRAMAEHIANHVRPERDASRKVELDLLLRPLAEKAVRLCREMNEAFFRFDRMQARFERASASGAPAAGALKEKAEAAGEDAARLMIEAHIACEEALGAARAIGFARRGEDWRPRDLRADAEAVFFGGAGV